MHILIFLTFLAIPLAGNFAAVADKGGGPLFSFVKSIQMITCGFGKKVCCPSFPNSSEDEEEGNEEQRNMQRVMSESMIRDIWKSSEKEGKENGHRNCQEMLKTTDREFDPESPYETNVPFKIIIHLGPKAVPKEVYVTACPYKRGSSERGLELLLSHGNTYVAFTNSSLKKEKLIDALKKEYLENPDLLETNVSYNSYKFSSGDTSSASSPSYAYLTSTSKKGSRSESSR